MPYRGRFAPSPTGLLHAGSLVAALASWLDAKAHEGTWLVRVEDVDQPRCSPAAAHAILGQLAACGMQSDEPVIWQSDRSSHYQQALNALATQNTLYACRCSRSTVAQNLAKLGIEVTRHQETPYPGTCRHLGLPLTKGHAVRWRPPMQPLEWHDRRLGVQVQNVSETVGDFVLKRQDGFWAYQLAVVVDDGLQGITHVVRGEDLRDEIGVRDRRRIADRRRHLPRLPRRTALGRVEDRAPARADEDRLRAGRGGARVGRRRVEPRYRVGRQRCSSAHGDCDRRQRQRGHRH